MSYNNQEYSNEFYETLYELGVYAQPDQKIAVSEKLPRGHVEEQYIVSFSSFGECVLYLESELENEVSNFIAIWNSLEDEIDQLTFEKPNYNPTIQDDLVFSFLNSIIIIAQNYEDLQEISKKMSMLKRDLFFIDNAFRERLGYFSILIQSTDAEILGENERLLILKHIQETNQDSKIKNMLKYAYYSPWGGMEEGVGPRGRNNPMTPFGGYDYWYDRVMDGTDLHDYSGGHATEKFVGRDGYNKFKKHPDLLKKTRIRLRTKPLRYLSREKRRRMKGKQKHQNRHNVSPSGMVKNELVTDPTHYYWWDQQRNNPYLWSDRGESGVSPTWETYR